MLPKKNRINKKLVNLLFKEGKTTFSPFLMLKYLINDSQGDKKIAFIVPKTISKKATDRNLLRRRGYATIKKYYPLIPFDFCGVFVFTKKSLTVFGGRKNKKNNPILNLENEIKNIFNKIN